MSGIVSIFVRSWLNQLGMRFRSGSSETCGTGGNSSFFLLLLLVRVFFVLALAFALAADMIIVLL